MRDDGHGRDADPVAVPLTVWPASEMKTKEANGQDRDKPGELCHLLPPTISAG